MITAEPTPAQVRWANRRVARRALLWQFGVVLPVAAVQAVLGLERGAGLPGASPVAAFLAVILVVWAPSLPRTPRAVAGALCLTVGTAVFALADLWTRRSWPDPSARLDWLPLAGVGGTAIALWTVGLLLLWPVRRLWERQTAVRELARVATRA